MTTAEIRPTPQTPDGAAPQFDRVLVGIDASPVSIEAAQQAALLGDLGATLTLLGAWTVPSAVGVVGPIAADDPDVYRTVAAGAVSAARTAIAGLATPETKLVRGAARDELLAEIERDGDTLVVVGSHGQGRVPGIVFGSTTTAMVHMAPCSVLVARSADAGFPRKIVVGVDGSPHSAAAYAVAHRLADRFGSELRPVVGYGGEEIDRERVEAIAGRRREDLPDEPVTALVAACADADLVVVGSRGLHGFKALGSVSERVAHRAHCSTLIVRPPSGATR